MPQGCIFLKKENHKPAASFTEIAIAIYIFYQLQWTLDQIERALSQEAFFFKKKKAFSEENPILWSFKYNMKISTYFICKDILKESVKNCHRSEVEDHSRIMARTGKSMKSKKAQKKNYMSWTLKSFMFLTIDLECRWIHNQSIDTFFPRLEIMEPDPWDNSVTEII